MVNPETATASTRRRARSRKLGVATAMVGSLALAAALPVAADASSSGVTVAGTISVPTGATAANTEALLLHDGSVAASQAVTAGTSATSGSYSFANVPDGKYQIYFVDPVGSDDAAPVYYGGATSYSSASTVTIAGASPALANTPLSAGGELTGTVTNANSVSSASLQACPVGTADAGALAYWQTLGNDCAPATIASNGTYTVGGLTPGASYQLQYTFASTSPAYSDRVYANGGGVTIDPGSASSITAGTAVTTDSFTVPAVGSISGAITDPSGVPDAGGSFALTDTAGTSVSRGGTLSAGAYTLAGLLPGQYQLQFTPASSTLTRVYSGNVVSPDSASWLTVASGATTANVNLTTTTGATISGTVTAAQGGADLGGIEVAALSAGGVRLVTTYTLSNGTYTLQRVPAGTVYLEFYGGEAYSGVRYQREYYGGTTTLGGATALTVSAGASLTGYNQAMMAQSTTAAGLPTLSNGWTAGEAAGKTTLRFTLTRGSGPAGYISGFRLHLPQNFCWNKTLLHSRLAIAYDTYTASIQNGWLVVTFPTGKKSASVRLTAGAITLAGGRPAAAKKHQMGPETFTVQTSDTTGVNSTSTYTARNPY